jgi:hypothetical protein
MSIAFCPGIVSTIGRVPNGKSRTTRRKVMDALRFFLDAHQAFHTSRRSSWLEPFTDEQIRWRPPDGRNSIAWLMWHIGRTEDFGVNRFVADRRQVLDSGEWFERMGVPYRMMGAGMTSAEVDDLSARIDVAALKGYLDAVAQSTEEVVQTLRSEILDEVVDPARVRQVVFDEGVGGPNGAWIAEVLLGKTKAYFLRHLALTHSYGHSYEAMTLRRDFGMPSR